MADPTQAPTPEPTLAPSPAPTVAPSPAPTEPPRMINSIVTQDPKQIEAMNKMAEAVRFGVIAQTALFTDHEVWFAIYRQLIAAGAKRPDAILAAKDAVHDYRDAFPGQDAPQISP